MWIIFKGQNTSNKINMQSKKNCLKLLLKADKMNQLFQCSIICAQSLRSCSKLHGKIGWKELSGKRLTMSIAN
eukprot:10278413-Karenia_brevis.AAC.1